LFAGAPGLAPGLTAPAGLHTPLIPPNFNFNAPVIHFGQTLSGATTISTPQPSLTPVAPVARPAFVQEMDVARLPPSTEDLLHTVFVGDIPDDMADQWMDRITRVIPIDLSFSITNVFQSLGKLKEWRRAIDGANKPRNFGFAIFEDAESTNRAYHMLAEMGIPNVQPGKSGSKLMV